MTIVRPGEEESVTPHTAAITRAYTVEVSEFGFLRGEPMEYNPRCLFRIEVTAKPDLAALAALVAPLPSAPPVFGVGAVVRQLSVLFRAGATDIPTSYVPWFEAVMASDPKLLAPAWSDAPPELTFIAAQIATNNRTFRED